MFKKEMWIIYILVHIMIMNTLKGPVLAEYIDKTH